MRLANLIHFSEASLRLMQMVAKLNNYGWNKEELRLKFCLIQNPKSQIIAVLVFLVLAGAG
jgi:hypothetical protein